MTGGARLRHLRRRVAVGAAALALVATAAYVPAALLAPLPAVAAEAAPVDVSVPPAPALTVPAYGAAGVEVLGVDGTRTLSGDTGPRSIASISKVVTALVVQDARPLDGGPGGSVTFTDADAALREQYLAVDGKVAPLAAGTTLTQRQVTEVMLVESANNYATALARWAFGSDRAYADAAAAWLAGHGLDDTTVVEPTGLSPENRSTTADLLELGRLALADPDVAAVVRTTSVVVPGAGVVENSNELLGTDGVVGIKTGTLDEAGACLLFAADQVVDGEPVTVVGVVLGGPDHDVVDADVRTLLAGVVDRSRRVDLVSAGDVLATWEAPWGARVRAVAAEDAAVTVWDDPRVTASVEADALDEGTAGERVGEVRWSVDDETVHVPLVLEGDLPGPSAWWRLAHPGQVF